MPRQVLDPKSKKETLSASVELRVKEDIAVWIREHPKCRPAEAVNILLKRGLAHDEDLVDTATFLAKFIELKGFTEEFKEFRLRFPGAHRCAEDCTNE